MEQCPDCFKEQKSINDKYKDLINEAQKLANKEKKEVAIFPNGKWYEFAIIEGQLPPNTQQIVCPL
jgi:hypothetical protein